MENGEGGVIATHATCWIPEPRKADGVGAGGLLDEGRVGDGLLNFDREFAASFCKDGDADGRRSGFSVKEFGEMSQGLHNFVPLPGIGPIFPFDMGPDIAVVNCDVFVVRNV